MYNWNQRKSILCRLDQMSERQYSYKFFILRLQLYFESDTQNGKNRRVFAVTKISIAYFL